MNEFLRERVMRRIDALPEDRVLQVLDYIEFLESRYATKPASAPSVVQRLAEGVQDTLRATNVSPAAIAETMGLMTKAIGILDGMKAAAESVASDVKASTTPKPPSP
jgi:MoxR-like ATPase